MQRTVSDHIAITPNFCGGRAHIAGHRIRVQDIVQWHDREGFSPDEIIARFEQLTLADVYAALAFYHDQREQIDAEMAADDSFAQSLKAATPSLLARKLIDRSRGGDSVSPG